MPSVRCSSVTSNIHLIRSALEVELCSTEACSGDNLLHNAFAQAKGLEATPCTKFWFRACKCNQKMPSHFFSLF